MTKEHVLREAVTRLFVLRSSKSPGGKKTREEDWLESIVKYLLNYSVDDKVEIPADLEILQSYDIFIALKDRIESNK